MNWFFVFTVACVLVSCKSQTGKNDFENRNRQQITYDFAFILNPRARDCFYEYIYEGSQIKFSYKVITPSTTMSTNAISAQIRSPKRQLAAAQTESEFDIPMFNVEEEGVHEFCFSNFVGKYLAKKVEVFIGVLGPHIPAVVVEEENTNSTSERYELMADQVDEIMRTIFHVGFFMGFRRRLENADFNFLVDNLAFINRSSIFMCLMIVFVACAQTYALRRLFHVRLSTSTNKPRA